MPKSFTSSSCLDTTTLWLGNSSRPAPSPPTTASHISPDSTAPPPPPANAARLWRHQQQLTAMDAGHGVASAWISPCEYWRSLGSTGALAGGRRELILPNAKGDPKAAP